MDNAELAAVVDARAYHEDPTYHYAADLLDLWLSDLKTVLGDCAIPDDVTRRVVDRLVENVKAGREMAAWQRTAVTHESARLPDLLPHAFRA